MKEARAIEDFVILPDGQIVVGAIVVRRQDSVVMADGSDIPDGLLADVKHMAGLPAPGRRRIKVPVAEPSSSKSKRGAR